MIAWSAGFNTHDKQWFQGTDFPTISMDKFSMLSIRDYQHPSGIEWLPDPSAAAIPKDFLKSQQNTIRKYGVIEHKDLPIKGIGYIEDRIKNSESLYNILKFICESEVVITNSYHCAYWSILLQRKTIVINKWSTKFNYFKYKPEFIESKNEDAVPVELLENASKVAQIYVNAYAEAVSMNDAYFERVKKLILELNVPKSKEYQEFYEMTYMKSWNIQSKLAEVSRLSERMEYLQNAINDLHDELYEVIDRLHDEVYVRINQEHEELYGAVNGLHDELYERINQEHDEFYKVLHKHRE